MKASALVVDDDPDLRSLIVTICEEAGLKTSSVDSGEAAQAWLADHDADILIVDIMMPDGNGIDLCKWVRAQKRLETVPILVSSAVKDDETAADALELGATDFLRKPFSPADLVAKLERWTKKG